MNVFRWKSPLYIMTYFVLFIIALMTGYMSYQIFILHDNSQLIIPAANIVLQNVYNESQSCPIPKNIDSMRYPKKRRPLPPLNCPIRQDLVKVLRGVIHLLNYQACSYQCISWKTDFDYILSKPIFLDGPKPATCSYFVVSCQSSDKDIIDKQMVFSAIRSKHLVNESVASLHDKQKPNDVIVIGIDSMSYKAFEYYLPKTFATLHNELNGVSFKKFNTMGDGTTVNVQAFLTGTKDTETYEARRRIAGSKPVDDFDWIWKHYKEMGYVTLYAEDMTDYGTFQYRLNGFEKQPTDFYLRTPFMVAERTGLYKEFCLGSKPMHSEYFKFFNQFQKTHNDVPKFSFTFFGLISHDDNKYASYLDDDLSGFITNLRVTNPEAFIILYSDHGHRFTSRLTMEGKYEERLPFLGISLPKSKENLKSVLETNSEILTSGLDLHATLKDVIGKYSPSTRSRSMSLLRPLPNDRKCADIESLPHWCSCLNWKTIDNPNANRKLIDAANAIVEIISEFTSSDRELCADLKLDKILIVYRLDAHSDVLKFKQSADVDGFVPDLSDKIRQTAHWYRMTLRTKPGDAEFDFTVSIDQASFRKGSKILIDKFRPEDVSRINKYAPWIKCLDGRMNNSSLVSDIRKFCICKDVLRSLA